MGEILGQKRPDSSKMESGQILRRDREGGERGFGKECWTDDRTEMHAIRFSTAFLAAL